MGFNLGSTLEIPGSFKKKADALVPPGGILFWLLWSTVWSSGFLSSLARSNVQPDVRTIGLESNIDATLGWIRDCLSEHSHRGSDPKEDRL